MARETIAQTMEKQRLLIFNSLKPQIAPLLANMGIDTEYLEGGKALYAETISISEQQKIEKQEENLAFDKFYELKNHCKDALSDNRRIIKMATRKDVELQKRIKMYDTPNLGIEEWIDQNITFYNLVNNEPQLAQTISRFGLSTEKLQSEINNLKQLRLLRNEATAEKGEAQASTSQRNQKMEALEDYCYELKTIASIALKSEPQLLEILGIIRN